MSDRISFESMYSDGYRDGYSEALKDMKDDEQSPERVSVGLLVDRIRELEDEIESLKLSVNPQDWKKAATQKLIMIGFLEAKSVIQNEAN